MLAYTVYAPWAHLIIAGWKPFEFRNWSFMAKPQTRALLNQRVVVHASKRAMKLQEIEWILAELDRGSRAVAPEARPLLERIRDAHKCMGVLPLGVGLGTVRMGKPFMVSASNTNDPPPDSSRYGHHLWAWPQIEPKAFPEPVEMKGAQGFWIWPAAVPEDCA